MVCKPQESLAARVQERAGPFAKFSFTFTPVSLLPAPQPSSLSSGLTGCSSLKLGIKNEPQAAVSAHSSHHASYLRGLAQVPRCREDPGSLLKMTPSAVDAVSYQSLCSPSTPQKLSSFATAADLWIWRQGGTFPGPRGWGGEHNRFAL